MRNTKLKRIPISTKSGLKHVRQESNDELLHQAILKEGFARLNISLRIKHHDLHSYAQWRGSSLTVDCPDLKAAKLFHDRLRQAVVHISQELGLAMPGTVILEKE